MAVVASHASAYTLIHVVGSTAFRAATTVAIIDELAGATASNYVKSKTVYAAYDAGPITSATEQIFANGVLPGTTNAGSDPAATVVIVTHWTGSAAGLIDLTVGATQNLFFDDTNATIQGDMYPLDSSTYLFAGSPETAAGPAGAIGQIDQSTAGQSVDMEMCDVNKFSVSSEMATATLTGTLTSPTGTFTSMAQIASAMKGSTVVDAGTNSTGNAGKVGHVAICPFVWAVGNMTSDSGTTVYSNDNSSFTVPSNITQNAADQLITAGFVAQGLLTGTAKQADFSTIFYLDGRNEDSGTRIAAFSEAQFGVTTAPFQYKIGDGSTTTNPTQYFPASTTLNGQPQIGWGTTGHSGYNGGSNVQAALDIPNDGNVTFAATNGGQAITGSPTNSFFIGYLGLPDAANALNGGAAKVLSYNGVTENATNIQNGTYTFWSYEHCYRKSNSADNATINTIADLIFKKDADVFYFAPTASGNGSTAVITGTSTSLPAGVTHAEQADGSYITGTVSGKTVPTLLSVGLFDDSFVNVTRSKTSEGTPVIHN